MIGRECCSATNLNFHCLKSYGINYVRLLKNEILNPRYLSRTVKHGGENVMVCVCCSGWGMGPIHKITSVMDRFIYRDILQNIMCPFAEWNMPVCFIFSHDNDPKHIAKTVKKLVLRKSSRC